MARYLKLFEAISSLFQGNMLYFLFVVVKEYLGLRYRQILWTIRLNLAKYWAYRVCISNNFNMQMLYSEQKGLG